MDLNSPSTWKVLLVDDEPDNLEVVAETLVFVGATVETAGSGAAALVILETFTPNLILLDLSMPHMNGWELRTRIKGLAQCNNIPVLAVSAHAMMGDKERALDAGFDGYLTKPISIGTFTKDVVQALQERPKPQVTGPLKLRLQEEPEGATPNSPAQPNIEGHKPATQVHPGNGTTNSIVLTADKTIIPDSVKVPTTGRLQTGQLRPQSNN